MEVLEVSKVAMLKTLEEAVVANGTVLEGGILKVDSFINHQIDPSLMKTAGQLVCEFFKAERVTKVLTAESSGIAPALATAECMRVPLIFARKKKPITMKNFLTELAPSHTKGGLIELNVSCEFLEERDRVLIVDDFLASGQTIAALARLVQKTGATLAGFAAVIEKTFERGRELLERYGVPVVGLVRISSLEPLKFVHDDCVSQSRQTF